MRQWISLVVLMCFVSGTQAALAGPTAATPISKENLQVVVNAYNSMIKDPKAVEAMLFRNKNLGDQDFLLNFSTNYDINKLPLAVLSGDQIVLAGKYNLRIKDLQNGIYSINDKEFTYKRGQSVREVVQSLEKILDMNPATTSWLDFVIPQAYAIVWWVGVLIVIGVIMLIRTINSLLYAQAEALKSQSDALKSALKPQSDANKLKAVASIQKETEDCKKGKADLSQNNGRNSGSPDVQFQAFQGMVTQINALNSLGGHRCQIGYGTTDNDSAEVVLCNSLAALKSCLAQSMAVINNNIKSSGQTIKGYNPDLFSTETVYYAPELEFKLSGSAR